MDFGAVLANQDGPALTSWHRTALRRTLAGLSRPFVNSPVLFMSHKNLQKSSKQSIKMKIFSANGQFIER